MTATGSLTHDSAEALAPEARAALRRLLLAVADTKLLLGYHYGEWTFGAPELEASVAHCSLGQSELGHVRLLHGLLLSQYGDDPDALVDERPAEAFANVSYLDAPIPDWAGVVAMTWVVDMAMTRLLHSMRASSFTPVRVSVEKILHEERYHAHHGQGWFRTLAGRDAESRAAIEAAVQRAVVSVTQWFGPPGEPDDAALVAAGVKDRSNVDLMAALLNDLRPAAEEAGVQLVPTDESDMSGWTAERRRAGAATPDAEVIDRLRGTKNALFKRT